MIKIILRIIIGIIFLAILVFVGFMAVQAHGWYQECYEDCVHTSPSPTPSPTATPKPTATPNPCDNEELLYWKKNPCVTPTPQPSETPVPTPGPGNSDTLVNDTTQAPSSNCSAPTNAPLLTGFKVNGKGSVTYSWWPSTSGSVDSQSIEYGYTKDNLPYGVNGLDKNQTSFTINDLAGFPVWARVGAWSQGCVVWSNELDP